MKKCRLFPVSLCFNIIMLHKQPIRAQDSSNESLLHHLGSKFKISKPEQIIYQNVPLDVKMSFPNVTRHKSGLLEVILFSNLHKLYTKMKLLVNVENSEICHLVHQLYSPNYGLTKNKQIPK